MNASLVNILSWSQPAKSTAALISVNVILWFLIRQRPLFVLPLALLVIYLRYLWKHRIRPEVLVDPPDHEEWVNLSTYDLEHAACTMGKNLWNSWVNLRHENHALWTVGTCTVWVVLAKIGTEVDFLTLLFVISNFAFVIFPLIEHFPHLDSSKVIETDDLLPDKPMPGVVIKTEVKAAAAESSSIGRSSYHHHSASTSSTSPSSLFEDAFGPVAVPFGDVKTEPSSAETTTYTSAASFYEGIMTRSMAAAAASIVASSSSVFASGMSSLPSSISSHIISSATSSLYPVLPSVQESSSAGPDSLTPTISQMPDHEVVDSDPEDEFLFDAKHFDRSSSSSISNSFEIIDDDL